MKIIQGTFEHINANSLFYESPSINGNKTLPKCPKRILRIDLNQMIQPQEVPKGTCTIGMPNMPPLEENKKSEPFFIILPITITSNTMDPPMTTSCEASTLIAKIVIRQQRKSLINISPIPQRNMVHHQIIMMSQGEASNTQTYQNKYSNIILMSKGHNQHPRLQQHQEVQGPNVPNAQPSQNPLNMHATYQHPQQQQKHQVVQGPNIPNMKPSLNPLDLHIMYQQQFQQEHTMFAKQKEKLKEKLEYKE